MLYLCEVCGYKTNRLFNFKRHEARMTPCKNKNENINMVMILVEEKSMLV